MGTPHSITNSVAQSAGFGLGQAGAHTIDDGHDQKKAEQGREPAEPVRHRAAAADPEAKRAEYEGAVALSHRPLITPRGAHHRTEHAGELRERKIGRASWRER